MQRSALVVTAALLTACGGGANPADKTAAPPPPPAPAPLNLADVAGKWMVKTMPETNDSVLVSYTIDAKADTAGWIINLPNRKPMPLRVSVSGDSVIMDAGPYESVLRKGVTVRTHGSSHLVGGKLVGITFAHYSVGPDSVRRLRTEGTKAP